MKVEEYDDCYKLTHDVNKEIYDMVLSFLDCHALAYEISEIPLEMMEDDDWNEAPTFEPLLNCILLMKERDEIIVRWMPDDDGNYNQLYVMSKKRWDEFQRIKNKGKEVKEDERQKRQKE